ILLCRVAEKTDAYGKWTLPGGGINFGEPPVDGMIREVEEETGLIVTSAGLVTVDSLVSHWEGTAYHHVRVIYFAKIVGGELRHEINGSTDLCQWWGKDECTNLGELAAFGIRLAFAQPNENPKPHEFTEPNSPNRP